MESNNISRIYKNAKMIIDKYNKNMSANDEVFFNNLNKDIASFVFLYSGTDKKCAIDLGNSILAYFEILKFKGE